jgi:hypothetical protein
MADNHIVRQYDEVLGWFYEKFPGNSGFSGSLTHKSEAGFQNRSFEGAPIFLEVS